jgi:enoyl-CoA hydratase
MKLDTVRYSVADRVARIEMNRPERRNALDGRMLEDLDAAFEAAAADREVHVVVLAGAGTSFCSGYDLGGSPYIYPPAEDGRWTADNALRVLRGIEARYRRIWDFPKPTVARVHGHAIAAGCYMQLLCDISVAAENATLGHPAVKWGGLTSMPLWQVALGMKKARYLLMTGRLIDGREAERIGLVTLAVPEEDLDAAVDGIVTDLLEVPPEGAFLNKEGLNTALEIMGVGTMYRYHRQVDALGRLRYQEPANIVETEGKS